MPVYTNPAIPRVCVTLADEKPLRTVTYVINTGATTTSLNIPFAVAIDGELLPQFRHKPPPRVSGDNGEIRVEKIAAGSTVALYLNSDAHPDYRDVPVFEFTLKEHNQDVEIWVAEELGKRKGDHHDRPEFRGSVSDLAIDLYEARLTGDIWKKVSHKYTPQEAAALVPAGTIGEVAAAVIQIYEELSTPALKFSVPRPGRPAKQIEVAFADSDNPVKNITDYELLRDGLPRVHPAGYAALFTAAVAAEAPDTPDAIKLSLSSAWRPCLGSIAHRAGLGLDVSMINKIPLNRQALRHAKEVDTKKKLSDEDKQRQNLVSDEEQRLFKKYEDAQADEARKDLKLKAKQKDLKATEAALDTAKAAEQKLQTAGVQKGKKSTSPARLAEAHAATERGTTRRDAARIAADDAASALKNAVKEREQAEEEWAAERDKHQPEVVRLFRASLVTNPASAQVFDPWLMDQDTKDAIAATPNEQRRSNENEKLHAHHLHLTVREPKILS